MRLRDAIETIPEAFVVWDADNRLVLCNSNFQELHNLPDEAITVGTSYESSSRPAASRWCAARSITGGPNIPGARTFEAQLEDGRWLHISERRTKDGGYVSVGTDITALKTHEEKLVDSEKRLMATVADVRASQQRLGRTRREIRRRKDPRRGSQPGQVEIPRQYEPRAAHAAQRHHRLFRDHGVGHVRPARRREIQRILQRHPRAAGNICSTSSTTSSTCRRSRPAASGSISRNSTSTRCWPKPCAWSRRARRTSSSNWSPKISPELALARRPPRAQADRAQSAVQRGEVHAGRRPRHGARARRRRLHRARDRRHRHRHREGRAGASSAGRSSRSKASSPRAIRARAWGSPSPSRWSNCTAAACASAPRSATARWWWCGCRS